MDLIWWLPAIVLIAGSLLLLARIRVVEREIEGTTAATKRLADLGESSAMLTAAVANTGSRRARTTQNLTRTPDSGADRGRNGAGR